MGVGGRVWDLSILIIQDLPFFIDIYRVNDTKKYWRTREEIGIIRSRI